MGAATEAPGRARRESVMVATTSIRRISDFGHTLLGRGLVVFRLSLLARPDRSHAATGVHHFARRRGSRVAARGARAAGAQRVRRIGVLIVAYTQTDPEAQARVAAFLDTLPEAGLGRRPQCPHRVSLGRRRGRWRQGRWRRNWSARHPM